MKRKREVERGSTIRRAIEELSVLAKATKQPVNEEEEEKDDDDTVYQQAVAHIPSYPFLCICNLLLQVLDKIGPTMAVLRGDVSQNIQRMEGLYSSDPSKYANVTEIIKKEVGEGTARKGNSCCRSFVWLTRSLDFSVALLQILVKEPMKTMEEAIEESYGITLKQWHGWISSAAFKVALKLVLDRETFIMLLMAQDEDQETLKKEIQTFSSLLVPFLEDIHTILRSYNLDRLKSP